MTAVSLALQGAIVTALKADATVKGFVGSGTTLQPTRIYDAVPDAPTFPYVSVGPAQVNRQDATCILGTEVFQQIDVWSRERGFVECKQIEDAIIAVLHDLDASNGGLSFTIEHRFTNTFRDSDGLTAHGVLSFRADIYIFA